MIDRDDFKMAIGKPDEGFNRALDAALRQIRKRKEKPIMKQKISVGLLIAIIAILTLTGAALAVGLNLFEWFGRDDARLAQIAPDTALQAETPAEVETDALGTAHAEFDSAYYDGQTLIAAYTIDNHLRYERFEPTDEWLRGALRQHRLLNNAIAFTDESNSPILDAYQQAVDKAEAFGYVIYTLDATDHCLTDDGIDLPPLTETQDVTADGKLCCIREFESPLPEAAQNRDSLTIRMPLKLYAYYVYFDGEYYYEAYESRDAGEMVATASRSKGITRRYAGEGSYNGVPIHAEAKASKVFATVEVTAQGEAFCDPRTVYPEARDDIWYDVLLEDENGAAFVTTVEAFDLDHASVDFDGNGHLPEQLKLYIVVEGEGDWDSERVRANTAPILLTPVE